SRDDRRDGTGDVRTGDHPAAARSRPGRVGQGPAAGKLISTGSVHASVASSGEGGLDPIQEAIRLFNDRFFFDAHEVLEEVWRQEHGESRAFLQGLIQICAAYHHTRSEEHTSELQSPYDLVCRLLH